MEDFLLRQFSGFFHAWGKKDLIFLGLFMALWTTPPPILSERIVNASLAGERKFGGSFFPAKIAPKMPVI